MPGRKILGLVCLIASIACLVVGYARLGLWTVMAVALTAFLVGLLAWKWPTTWMPTVSLCACICLAAIGVFSGALPLMMVIFSTLGLVNWDLALLDRDPINSTSWKTATLLEKKHYASLALALGPGLLAATIGRLVHFRIPFGGMLVLVILVLFSLNQLWSLLITAPRRT